MRLKDDPYVKAIRKDLANLYRKLRRERPEMARLFYERNKNAQKKLNNFVIKHYFS